MKVLNLFFIGAILAPAMAMGLDIDQQQQPGDQPTDPSMSSIPEEDVGTGGSAISLDHLIGSRVRASNSNEEIGVLEDILIDSTGRPLLAIISIGTFLGIGEKEVAIDWSRVSVVPDQPEATGQFHDPDSFVLMINIHQQTLKDVPEFGRIRE